MELLERKKENQRLLEEENARLRGKAIKEAGAEGKVTRAQIEETLLNEQLQKEQMEPKGKVHGEDNDQSAQVVVGIHVKLQWGLVAIQACWL